MRTPLRTNPPARPVRNRVLNGYVAAGLAGLAIVTTACGSATPDDNAPACAAFDHAFRQWHHDHDNRAFITGLDRAVSKTGSNKLRGPLQAVAANVRALDADPSRQVAVVQAIALVRKVCPAK